MKLRYLVEPERDRNGAAVGFSQELYKAILPMESDPSSDAYGDGYREALESMALAMIAAGALPSVVDAAIHTALDDYASRA